MDTNPKTQYGLAKPGISNVPPVALLELGSVMDLGAAKYGPMNWRASPVSASTYYNALMRHAFEYWDGRYLDSESRRAILAHVMACCAILIDAEAGGNLIDDRPIAGTTHDYIVLNTREVLPK